MNPVIPCSVGNVSFFSGSAFLTRKNNSLTTLSFSRKSVKHGSSSRKFLWAPFVSIGLFPQNIRRCSFQPKSRTLILATETEIAVEEPDSPVADEDSTGASESPSDEAGISEDSSPKPKADSAPTKARRSRSARKSEMPPVKNEDLIPGATFTGKVKSIQPFGAFIDFGAFTDGLVHVSRLSDSYVKDVASVVSVGQEVKVKLIEVNTETQRISLSMRESDDNIKLQQRRDAPVSTEKAAGPGRRTASKPGPKKDDVKKSTKFVKGQDLDGTVKNMTRSGAFISLPDGEEGFLPISEESDDGFGNVMGTSSLQVGQEVSVRVLRITRGSVTLTMKKEEDIAGLDSEISQGVVHAATNPFVLAFRKNKDIAKFLDEREQMQKAVGKPSTETTSVESRGTVKQLETELDVPHVLDEPQSIEKLMDSVPSAVKDNDEDVASKDEVGVGATTFDGASTATSEEIKGTFKQLETELDVPCVVNEPDSSEKLMDSVPSTVKDNAEDDASKDEVGAGATTLDGASAVTSEEIKGTVKQLETELDVTHVLDEPESSEKLMDGVPSAVKDNDEDDASKDEAGVGATTLDGASTATSAEIKGTIKQLETELDVPRVVDEPESREKLMDSVPSAVKDNAEDDASKDEVGAGATIVDGASTLTSEEIKGTVKQLETELDVPHVLDEPESSEKLMDSAPSAVKDNPEDDASKDEVGVGATILDGTSTAILDDERDPISNISSVVSGVGGDSEKEAEVTSGSVAPDGDVSTANEIVEETTQTDATAINIKSESPHKIASEIVTQSGADHTVAEDEKQLQTSNAEKESTTATPTDNEGFEPNLDINGSITGSDIESIALAPLETEDDKVGAEAENSDSDTSSSGQTVMLSSEISLNTDGTEGNDQVLSPISHPTKVANNSVDDLKEEGQNLSTAPENESSFNSQVEDKEIGIASGIDSSLSNANGQSGNTASEQGSSKATISPALVKQLREETGAGMMDCKKALSETGGDIIKAQEFLRKKGLASAEKKASRVTAEGKIGSYIHDSRIGVLVEVNCETDFVSRGEIFKELVDDIAMQVAACPQVEYLVAEDVPEEIVNKEKEIEMQKEDLLSKPEQIRSKIVEGRIRKRLEDLALLEQPYIKNDKVAVKDWVKQTVATVGENIKVKRFVRFNLGEGLEKKSQDFAAEVAAQTAAKPVPMPEKEQPAVAEAKETERKSPTVVVSASLVKKLREETGAGMMDCKKALAETGGDLEKAQEYLRKKGLSTAEKKSSRLAAEGRIGSYIHDSRIGVLIEVNCETDFVGRSEKFKELVDNLAMQVVACPQVQFVSIEDVPESIVNREKELEMQREDLLSKPENIRERIVEGRVSKRLGELALLEQPFIKDDSILVKDLVKQTVAGIGENIKVRRFVRFTLGETAESETTVPA